MRCRLWEMTTGSFEVPARPVIADLVKVDFKIEFDFRNVIGKFGATAHDESPFGETDSTRSSAAQ
jgi:hypothetical protein